MKLRMALAIAATLGFGGLSQAQTAAPEAGQTLTPAQQANRDRIKGERETCRTQAQNQGLKGPAVRAAVMDCMSKADPVAAKRMGCAQQARAQNLTGDAMKGAVRACMTGAG